jgi:hypothetical protein
MNNDTQAVLTASDPRIAGLCERGERLAHHLELQHLQLTELKHRLGIAARPPRSLSGYALA